MVSRGSSAGSAAHSAFCSDARSPSWFAGADAASEAELSRYVMTMHAIPGERLPMALVPWARFTGIAAA